MTQLNWQSASILACTKHGFDPDLINPYIGFMPIISVLDGQSQEDQRLRVIPLLHSESDGSLDYIRLHRKEGRKVRREEGRM